LDFNWLEAILVLMNCAKLVLQFADLLLSSAAVLWNQQLQKDPSNCSQAVAFRNLTIFPYLNVTNFEKLFFFFSYFGFLFNFSEKNHLNSISNGTYVVLNVNPLPNKVSSTYDHCFAKGMYEFKYICNL
jgi:hypothetical protein